MPRGKKKRGPGRPKGSKNKVVQTKSDSRTRPLDDFDALGLNKEMSPQEAAEAQSRLFRNPSATSSSWQFDGAMGGDTQFLDASRGGQDARLDDSNIIAKINRMEKQMYFMVSKYRAIEKMIFESTSRMNAYLDNQVQGMRIR